MIPLLLSAPALEPISLDEAKAWLRIDSSEEDQLIAALIVSARLTLEAFTRRLFVTQSWRLTFDAWPASVARRNILPIPLAPSQSVTAIRVHGASGAPQLLDAASYNSALSRVVFAAPPPAPGRATDGVEVDVVAGYGDAASDTPEPLRRAMLALVAHWHENRGDATDEPWHLPTLVATLTRPYRRERLT